MAEVGERRQLKEFRGEKRPLNLTYEVCETSDNIERNIRRTLESSYVPFNSLLDLPHDRTVSVVGFGPSLENTYKDLDGDIWACNGAHNWLIDRGVIPKYAMFWDASPVIAKFVKPNKDVTYLIGSRCHKSVFKLLEGYKVFVMQIGGDECLERLLEEYRIFEPVLGGGSAAVTRAMVIVTTMGYRKIKLFGADCSTETEVTHLKKSIVNEELLTVWMDGKDYTSTAWLAGQVEDFKILAPALRKQGCELEVFGSGLLPHVARINGFAVHP
jgi:hypothetical protein